MLKQTIATGRWLRADAAESYERMRAAGMPAGGVAAAGRTYAQQLALWLAYRAGTGNLAARPGTSLHETGLALDMTRGTPAQVWMTAGGDPWHVTPTGSIRANEFGWSRTVPSEAWHFSYDPKKDRHMPATLTAAPALLLGVANCQSYDGDRTEAAWRARGVLMAAQGRNAWAVCETTSAGRALLLEELGKATGHVWKTWTLDGKTVAVLFDSAVWSWRKIRKAGPHSPFGHGSLAVPLWHQAGGWGVDLIAHHTRPGSIATDQQKAADIAKGAALAGKWPAVLAGDFARSTPILPGWTRSTPDADTMDSEGNQRVDAAYTRGLVASGGRLVDPGELSDHKWLTVDLRPLPVPSAL